MKENKLFVTIGRIIMIVIGAMIAAYGLEAVLIPNNVIDGGVNSTV